MKQHPKSTFLIAFTQMWESFSFYGMRALLVLYLIQKLGYVDNEAFTLYALYISLVEVGSFIGGYFADRYLGLKAAILWGGGFITAGHLCLACNTCFFIGLSLIILGSTLFRSNLHALLGLFYEDTVLRNNGYTFLYTAMNLGGFIASLLCSFVALTYGWHFGFGLAAFGMILGLLVFVLNLPLLKNAEPKYPVKIVAPLLGGLIATILFTALLTHAHLSTLFILPLALISFILLGKTLPKQIFPPLLLLIAYFSVEELMGSFLVVFSEDQINRLFFGFTIPSSALIAVNPLVIILLGPLFTRFNMPLSKRLSIAFLCLFFAFAILYAITFMPNPPLIYLLASFSIIATGELFLAPAIFAFSSSIAPQGKIGLTMGLVTLAFSLASLLSGHISNLPIAPSTLFLTIALSALLLFLLLLKLRSWEKIKVIHPLLGKL